VNYTSSAAFRFLRCPGQLEVAVSYLAHEFTQRVLILADPPPISKSSWIRGYHCDGRFTSNRGVKEGRSPSRTTQCPQREEGCGDGRMEYVPTQNVGELIRACLVFPTRSTRIILINNIVSDCLPVSLGSISMACRPRAVGGGWSTATLHSLSASNVRSD